MRRAHKRAPTSLSFRLSIPLFIHLPLPVCQPFSRSHSLRLSPSDSLSDLDPPVPDSEADRLQLSQPGSCVLLVLCHGGGALADLLCVCLEELKDALSPGTFGLPSSQKGSVSEIVLGKRSQTGGDSGGDGHKSGTENRYLILGKILVTQHDVAVVVRQSGPASSHRTRWFSGFFFFPCFFFVLQYPCPHGRL